MYASFRSVTAKNGKILTPTRTGNFLLTSMDPEILRDEMLWAINFDGASVQQRKSAAVVLVFKAGAFRY